MDAIAIYIVYVADQQRSRDFYRDVLMQEPVLDVPGMTEFQLGPGCKLGIMPENGVARLLGDRIPHPSLGSGIPRSEVYLYIKNPIDYFKRAIKAGGVSISMPKACDWGDTVAYCADPDGHIIAFAERTA
ncbi:VOC family protein [Williamwhitmania taraxaci]|nr:lactoylglutathione lyase [Williamwhitmania taraxaci]